MSAQYTFSFVFNRASPQCIFSGEKPNLFDTSWSHKVDEISQKSPPWPAGVWRSPKLSTEL